MTDLFKDAKPGDKFEARDGGIWEFVKHISDGRNVAILDGLVSGIADFRADGSFWDVPDSWDIIRPLDAEKVDGRWVEGDYGSRIFMTAEDFEEAAIKPTLTKYDPEIHGDGLTVMVPMYVEPPSETRVTLWDDSQPITTWLVGYAEFQSLLDLPENESVRGWTFAPALPPKPEAVKSYAGCLNEGGNYDHAPLKLVGRVDDAYICCDMIVRNPDHASALIHFIFDHLPTDKDRADILALLSDGEG